jgi:hypothetical protein
LSGSIEIAVKHCSMWCVFSETQPRQVSHKLRKKRTGQ